MEMVEPVPQLHQRFRAMPSGAIISRTPTRFDFEDFFENGAIALHLVGSDGLHANKAELDLLGYTAEEYIGRCITEFHAD